MSDLDRSLLRITATPDSLRLSVEPASVTKSPFPDHRVSAKPRHPMFILNIFDSTVSTFPIVRMVRVFHVPVPHLLRFELSRYRRCFDIASPLVL